MTMVNLLILDNANIVPAVFILLPPLNLLWIINTGQLEYLKGRIQSRTDALNWLENEIKMKENYLNSLDYGIREVIPMTNSANELTYRPDNMYPSLPDDTNIKSIPYMQD
jgi:hypothetical protein